MIKLLFLFIMIPSLVAAQNVPQEWLTFYEQSGGKKTPNYAQTMDFCRRLEKASPFIKVTSFGKSPQGRDLPLVILSKDKAFDPAKAAKTDKAIMLIQNGIHSGEIDGKDACLMLMRDIAVTKSKAALLDHVILLIIPIYSVDAHERSGPYNRINQAGPEEMGWRVTAQNLNLNRDYMKADAPETQAWLKLFNAWLPDFFIDCHVTDGADFQYTLTYGIETKDNVAAPVRAWIREKFLPSISSLKFNGVPAAPLLYLRDDLDPLKGLAGTEGTGPPRFSTVYTPLQNRPGMLIEMHMLKDYKSRVTANYDFLDATIRQVDAEYASLRKAVRLADEQTSAGLRTPYTLTYESDTIANKQFHFLGYRQKNEKSDISGGTRRTYSREPFEADIPYYDSLNPGKSINPPVAYLIPQEWQEVIARLRIHGIRLERLTSPAEVEVQRYRFSNAKWATAPFEGRIGVKYDVNMSTGRESFPAGTIVVPLNQRAAKVAIHLLEPEAPDAFAAWGFFNAVFEQKEYAEDYVLEPLASEMLSKDAALKHEFETTLRNDTTFAKSASARLNFFYQRSPYWDSHVNLYPVARLVSGEHLKTETVK